MKQLEIKIDLVSDWQEGIYNWYAENYGLKWRFVEVRNATLEAAVLRRDFASVPKKERGALVCYYYNLRHRIVRPAKRKLIVLDQEHLFANIASDKIDDVKSGWAAFSSDVGSGLNFEIRQTEKRFDIDGKDVLLDRFKIHHFHICGDPKKRGDYVAYCFVTDDAVKVITLESHRAFCSAELCHSIVEKAYRLYPEEFTLFMVQENVSETQDDLATQKKLSWMNINSHFRIGDKQFYPIGMGTMMNGVSLVAYRWMMRDQRLFSAANNAMKELADDNISVMAQMVSDLTAVATFRLFCREGSVVEARSEDESFRITYDMATGNVALSCVDTLVRRLRIKETALNSSKVEVPIV